MSIDGDAPDAEAPPRRLTRAEAKAQTRARLLDAAAQVFARKGFGGASVDEIAETAGYSTGALYSNFGGKDELFMELLASRTRFRQEAAVAVVGSGDRTLEQVRAELNRILVEFADEDNDVALLQAELWLYAIRRPELLEQLAARFRGNRDALTELLAGRAQARGRSEEVPFTDLATVVLALFQGLVQLRRTDPELVPPELYGTALRWLFNGAGNASKPDEG
ncbi:TetR/AcrR family transcriptional regulator [Catenulispora sp. NF23]|uniref:TetR/AcrR family transcriptional regulator n=1 Tax=Catenulispora pinistramenti TaxID=2705254 RepID=A0ABS5KU55_9ACTN|nr:TetR/AcrR family transcriptional regulator [Catenulispora pinistramenti]MBS2533787.1 TetR/AcrR family transcriptional regulator [Catenulispora pinistramenti]MBS2549573.1 TetR/AcrR family transcriptional regulator [Catenulispora pinistramenti]